MIKASYVKRRIYGITSPMELLSRLMVDKKFEVVCLLDRVKWQRENRRIAESVTDSRMFPVSNGLNIFLKNMSP